MCLTAQVVAVSLQLIASRRTLSQFWSFKIRHTTFLNYIKFVNLLIKRLNNCERVRRVLRKDSLPR